MAGARLAAFEPGIELTGVLTPPIQAREMRQLGRWLSWRRDTTHHTVEMGENHGKHVDEGERLQRNARSRAPGSGSVDADGVTVSEPCSMGSGPTAERTRAVITRCLETSHHLF
jgi:hypothetical protein